MTSPGRSHDIMMPIARRSGDDDLLSVDGDMATVVAAMMRAGSGVAVRNRMWLKVVIPDAFTGGDAVGWLRRNVAGAAKRADARRYAADLLQRGFIRHAVNARAHKRFSAKRYYVVGGESIVGRPSGRPRFRSPPPGGAAHLSSLADLSQITAVGGRDGGGAAHLWTTSSADCLDRRRQSDHRDLCDHRDQSDHRDLCDHRDQSDQSDF
ncbi:segment polarity protein dishevelled-like [Vanacampus margaritifer]